VEVLLHQRVGDADDEEIEPVEQNPEPGEQPEADVQPRHRRLV
jgi:hypothetical protein